MTNTHFKSPDNKHISQEPLRSLTEPLIVLFNYAASSVLPGKNFIMEYSVPGGIYGYFCDFTPTNKQINNIKQKIKGVIKSGAKINHEKFTHDELISYFNGCGRTDIIDLINSKGEESKCKSLSVLHMNGNGELFLNNVKENYDKLINFRLFRYAKGFFLIADIDFFDRVMPHRLETSKFLKRFEETQNSMKYFGVSTVSQLNDIIKQGELSDLIKISEAYQSKKISRIADNIIGHPLKPRVIFLSGPTSSGKTTSANRLAIELKVLKRKVIILSLDNFYLPHSKIPIDPDTGLQNFELITALDLNLFKETINALLRKELVYLPKYYFDGQGAKPSKKATQIDDDTYIIIEGIHGLNPQLWQNVMEVESYRLYVSALSTIKIHDHLPVSTSDHRLIRRLVRDYLFRGYDINETLKRWPDVINNEYRSIFPFQESAHDIFNSALIYEIAVFAHYAPSILKGENAKSSIIAEQIEKLNRLLYLFISIDPADIPFTSILREFIGGSSFDY